MKLRKSFYKISRLLFKKPSVEGFFCCPLYGSKVLQTLLWICQCTVDRSYRLRRRSLPLTLRYIDKFSQLLHSCPLLKRNGAYSPSSPINLRLLGPPACASHTSRPFTTGYRTTSSFLKGFSFGHGNFIAWYHTFHSSNKGKYTNTCIQLKLVQL